jgi:preprotein translocase subunit SecG
MVNFLIGLFTGILVLTSLFIVLIVLLQRGAGEGLGTAFGGGAVESALGGDTNRVLVRITVFAAVLFFVLGFGLYLGQLASHRKAEAPVAIEAALQAAEADSAARLAATEVPAPQPGEATEAANKLLNEETPGTPSPAPAAPVQPVQ